ncbi:uncharacterized protein LOC114722258 [Neltuma alba]|uniref:uncharacterized protein LOC114722258 n=1 Tax=Neltuma alba TaxID=207710 RepID=UPI0010A3C9FC|nr:uncharacterized protein LOC114722258 [Prosopis alba]
MASRGCHGGFSSTYMLLKPEEVRLFDLIHILFFPNLHKTKFVDSPEATFNDGFRHRWLIFISIFAQKFLQSVAKPLASIGSFAEMWLNLVSSNHNLFQLLLNFLTGKVEKPDKTSAKYLSFIGNLDKRVQLDDRIRRGDSGYNAAVCMMASKAAYENEAYLRTTVQDRWKMEFVGSYDFWNEYQEKATTQAFIGLDKSEEVDTYVVAFRGTEAFDADAWCSDLDISWYKIPGTGKIHGGFMKALGLQKNVGWPKEVAVRHEDSVSDHPPVAYYAIRNILRDCLSANNKANFILTGHSLGGALAILFPAILVLHDEAFLLDRLDGVYTFGQPRVGDEAFAEFMEQKLEDHGIRYHRFVYCNDIVPRLPYDDLMFKHFGTCYYYNRHYQAKVVKEEPNKNYFSPLLAIPMMVNAFLELIRSFAIVYIKGSEYKEGAASFSNSCTSFRFPINSIPIFAQSPTAFSSQYKARFFIFEFSH